jgi:glycine dehydrogenase subunit 1
MSYLPLTDGERKTMLSSMGYSSIDQLFTDAGLSEKVKLGLGESMSEAEVSAHITKLAGEIASPAVSFAGAGAYDHLIPSVINHLTSRAEFYTAYTPYQPEISQGTLQAIYEYQTMICELSAMDVANASMYDGGSALAESALLSLRATNRKRILVAESIHPRYREVLNTYLSGLDVEIISIPFDQKTGMVDTACIERNADGSSAVLLQNPNFFGVVEEFAPRIAELIHRTGGLFIVSADPISLGIMEAPGNYGADIYTAEGQGLGTPLSFGGPYLGIMAGKANLARNMPGRLVGRTTDSAGRTGYVLTLQTREQHIRRQKATSNICSNQALVALSANIFLAVLGKEGIYELALQNLAKAEYAKRKLKEKGLKLCFGGANFNEFVVELPVTSAKVYKDLSKQGVVPGITLDRWYPQLKKHLLVCVTEKRTKAEIDRLADLLGRLVK